MTLALFHPRYAAYSFGEHHPFSPLRTEMAIDLLRGYGCEPEWVAPPPATTAELLEIHEEAYVDACARASRAGAVAEEIYGLGSADNPLAEGLDEGARHLVGGALFGARRIREGKARRVLQFGGGLHHAQRALASGFCLYNDLAVAIAELVRGGLRVAYIDLDVHHGDGVQQIFYGSEEVLTLSLHQSGEFLFPGTGWIHELGVGMGRGFKLNLPLAPYTEDDSWIEVLEAVAGPALEYFMPQVLVVQAGADGHFLDPLADLLLSTRAYERAFRLLLDLADRHCDGRILFTLGGGYSFNAAPRVWALLTMILQDAPIPTELPRGWVEKWRDPLDRTPPPAFLDGDRAILSPERREPISAANRRVAQRLLDALSPLWP